MLFIINQVCTALFATDDDTTTPREKATTQQVFDAVDSGEVTRVNALFSDYDVDLTAIDDAHGDTPMHRAASQGDHRIVKILLEHADNDPQILEAINRKGLPPLLSAAEKPSIPTIISLIEAGANVGNLSNLMFQLNLSVNERLSYIYRIDLIKVLAQAKGDLRKAIEISSTSQYSRAQLWCLKEIGNPMIIFQTAIKEGFYDQIDSWPNYKIFTSLKEMIELQQITFDEMISLIDLANQSEKKNAGSLIIKACNKNKLSTNILMHYLLKENTDTSKMFLENMSDSMLKEKLLNISEMKDLPEAERISAMKLMMSIVAPKFEVWEFCYGSPDKFNLLFAAGLRIPVESIAQRFLLNPSSFRKIEEIKTLFRFGLTPDDACRLCGKEELTNPIAIDIAKIALMHVFLDNQQFADRDAMLQELKKCLDYGPTIVEAAKARLLEEVKAERFDRVQLFIDAKVPTVDLMIAIAKSGNLIHAMEVFQVGGDIGSALEKMIGEIKEAVDESKSRDAQAMIAAQDLQEARAMQQAAELDGQVALDSHTALIHKLTRAASYAAFRADMDIIEANEVSEKLQPRVNILTLAAALQTKARQLDSTSN